MKDYLGGMSAIKEMLVIWREEYAKIFTDFGVLLLFLGATLVYPLLYSAAYAPEVLENTPIALVDNDNSTTSRAFARMVEATQEVSITLETAGMKHAKKAFFEGKIQGILLLPDNFTQEVMRGEQAHVAVYCDGSYFMHYKQVYQGVAEALGTLNAGVQVKQLMADGMARKTAVNAARQIDYSSYPLYNPAGGYGTYVMPAVLILILQQTLLMGIGMLGGTDRERKSFHYLAPLAANRGGAARVVLGKAGAYFSLYMIIAFYLLVLVVRWFNFPQQGEITHILWFVLPLLLSVCFLGLFLATFFKNREMSMIVLLFTSIPLLFLSGFSWPWEAFPSGFRYMAHLVPSTPGIRGFIKINQMGGTLQDASFEWLELWIMTAVFFIAAVWRMQRIINHAKQLQTME